MEKEHPEVELDLRCMEYGELIRAHRPHTVDVIFKWDEAYDEIAEKFLYYE